MSKSQIVVYFLLDNTFQRMSYRGYSTCLKRRIRQHNGQIKGGARYTRKSNNWVVLAYISGFQSKKVAMSYEWYTKRRRLTCHEKMMKFSSPHIRLQKFFAPLFAKKFTPIRNHLTVHMAQDFFDDAFTQRIQNYYSLTSVMRFSKLQLDQIFQEPHQ